MSGIYQAANYCDSCCAEIAKELMGKGEIPAYWTADDLASVRLEDNNPLQAGLYADSGDWPSWGYPDDLLDYPGHCAMESLCVNRVHLCDYGLSSDDTLYGAEARSVGAVIGTLSLEGIRYVKDLEPARTPYQKALHSLWNEYFFDYLG